MGVKSFQKKGHHTTITNNGQIFSKESQRSSYTLDNAIENLKKTVSQKSLIKIAALRVIFSH